MYSFHSLLLQISIVHYFSILNPNAMSENPIADALRHSALSSPRF